MTRLLNNIPFIGWLMAAALAFIFAIPLYFLWNGLAPTYFFFLPPVYHYIPFWSMVGLVWLLRMLLTFSPFVVTSSSNSKVNLPKEEG